MSENLGFTGYLVFFIFLGCLIGIPFLILVIDEIRDALKSGAIKIYFEKEGEEKED